MSDGDLIRRGDMIRVACPDGGCGGVCHSCHALRFAPPDAVAAAAMRLAEAVDAFDPAGEARKRLTDYGKTLRFANMRAALAAYRAARDGAK